MHVVASRASASRRAGKVISSRAIP